MKIHMRGTPSSVIPRRGWAREAIELAALFLAVGAGHLFTFVLGHQPYGTIALIGTGVALAAGVGVRRWWTHRHDHHTDSPTWNVFARSRRHRAKTSDLWRIRVTLDDTPGRLAMLASGLASLQMNIRTMHVHPVYTGAVDEFLVSVPAGVTDSEITRTVTAAGGTSVHVSPADPHELADSSARSLALAQRLVDHPDQVTTVLRDLLRADDVRRAAGEPAADSLDGTTMRLSGYVLSRAGMPFTPAEFARARAMVDLAIALAPSGAR